MSPAPLSESTVEQATLDWLENLGWLTAHGPNIAPGAPVADRADYGEVVLARRLRDSLTRLNPDLPAAALDDAFRKLTRPQGSTRGLAAEQLSPYAIGRKVACSFSARYS